jgi:hypothetical protein
MSQFGADIFDEEPPPPPPTSPSKPPGQEPAEPTRSDPAGNEPGRDERGEPVREGRAGADPEPRRGEPDFEDRDFADRAFPDRASERGGRSQTPVEDSPRHGDRSEPHEQLAEATHGDAPRDASEGRRHHERPPEGRGHRRFGRFGDGARDEAEARRDDRGRGDRRPERHDPHDDRGHRDRTATHQEGSRHEGRHRDEHRRDEHRRDEHRREWHRRDEPRREGHGPRSAAQTRRAERLGILVDLDALQTEASQRGGELSFHKLLRCIAGDARVVRAVCYLVHGTAVATKRALRTTGFELQEYATAAEAEAAMQQAATQTDWAVDTLVLLPMTAGLAGRIDEFVRASIRIEAASFDGTARSGLPARQLGRGCLFVP